MYMLRRERNANFLFMIFWVSVFFVCVPYELLAENIQDCFVEHFDSYPSSRVWSANAQDLSRIEIVDNPVRASSGAVKLTVFPEDISAKRNRAEINIIYGQKPKGKNWKNIWYSWSFLIPEDYHDDYNNKRFQIMGQFHVVPDFERGEGWEDYLKIPPMISIRYGRDEGGSGFGLFYGIKTAEKQERMIAKKYIEKGRWYDIMMHINWSKHEDGYVEVWLDNEPLTPFNGKDYKFYGANMYNAVPPMLKLGLYRDFGFKRTNSVYYDELHIGHSKEAVNIRQ